ncbi:DNA-binding transcriptional LysR family regulator [Devosia sp. UYZn731]|uniref:LysR family transcriptional regulator n=1 Tax=Devosia sp. UYZn731 TaxID=3156345 RepID=UPI00339A65B8
MDRVDAMRLFTRAVDMGSFAAAARDAGIGQPAVSKQIAGLEQHFGAQLIRRTSRSMALTEAGLRFYEAALRLIDEFDSLEASINSQQASPVGVVRLSTAPVFGRLRIVPHLPALFVRYPRIVVEISASERPVNLIEEGLDLAIRVGEVADSTMTVRKLGKAPFVTVATPDYLRTHGTPTTVADLTDHVCITFISRGEIRAWAFADATGPILHHPNGNFRSADAEQILAAVVAGIGVAHGPEYMFADDIAVGRLNVFLANLQPPPLAISAIHPAGRLLSARVRVLIDYLADILREP